MNDLKSEIVDFPENLKDLTVSDYPIRSGTILAVDDDKASLEMLKDLISMSGFQVFGASDGNEAMAVFSEKHPDLVITDIRMPHSDGLEVLRNIREMDETVPVILVTGYGDLDNALRALRRGAHDFLLKPINAEILLNTVIKGIELGRLKRLERDYRRLLEEQVDERTKELAKTNDFLQGILDSSTGVSIVLTDPNGKIIFWNTGAENLYGYTSDRILGSDILDLYPERFYGEEVLKNVSLMMKNGAPTVQQNIKQVSIDGRKLTIFMTMSHMRDGSGNVRGILGLGQDVTEQVILHEELLESYRRTKKIQEASILAIAQLAESRDEETSFHLKRIQAYCRALCHRLSLRERYREFITKEFIENLVQGSVLHDIGKVGLPDAILFSIDKFSDEEFELMKQHTIKGGKALEEAARESGEVEGYLTTGKDVAYYHHEHWSGTGYPFGLKGEEIPLVARIVSIVDVYDALITVRRYKKAYAHQEAYEVIIKEKGKQFDPELVEAFIEVEQVFQDIRDSFSQENSS